MKRRLFCDLAVSLSLWVAAALPGVKRVVEDTSGEYVFYRDFTFTGEAYVGFLYYNEATYAARFWCKADPKTKTPERDITIYVSANPENTSGLELTGEKLVGANPASREDTQVVNYLHELLYEFTSRRQKASLADEGRTTLRQEFSQFGGNVDVLFDPLVPLFNIEAIKGGGKKDLFSLRIVGRLESSSDESFLLFRGVEGLPKDKKRTFKSKKKASKDSVTFEGMSVTVDEQWQRPMDNLWLLGDFAVLSMTSFDVPEDDKAVKEQLVRRFCESSGSSYALWAYKKVEEDTSQKQLRVSNLFFDSETGDVKRDFKLLNEELGGTMSILSLAVFDGVYQKNRKYFEAILKSYQVSP